MNDFNAQLQALSQRVMQHSVIQEDKTEYNKTLPSESIEKEVVLYQTDDGNVNVSVLFNDETFWLTQKTMGELFGVASNTITYHLQEIFKSGELVENSVTRIFRATASDGKKYNTKFYNLDAIISVGYRVNSMQATRFRQWASQTLKEYIIKGFVMNDEFLKNGPKFGKDYFDELLERIKEIRASERRFYQNSAKQVIVCHYWSYCARNYTRTRG